jgi:hypothetical protein
MKNSECPTCSQSAYRRARKIVVSLTALCILILIGIFMAGCRSTQKIVLAPAAVSAVAPETVHEDIVVPFAYDSSVPIILPAIFQPTYDRMVVEGHADARGSDAYNEVLSLRRADAVVSSMRAIGVTSEIVVEVFGKRRLLCYDMTESCHARNRRVVVKMEKGDHARP